MSFIKIALSLLVLFGMACGSADEDRSFAGGENTNTSQPPAQPGPTATPSAQSTPQPTATPANVSSSRINSFLWKPESERDGNLVVLVSPTNVRIVVSGSISETLGNSGASNGYGTTGRGSFGGCSYGEDITVEFFNQRGQRILTQGGRTSLNIPRGCDRFQF